MLLVFFLIMPHLLGQVHTGKFLLKVAFESCLSCVCSALSKVSCFEKWLSHNRMFSVLWKSLSNFTKKL